MGWEQYYKDRPLSLEGYINNIWEHKPLLIEVASSGRNILEVATGTGNLSIFLSHLGYNVVSLDKDDSVLKIAQHNNANFKGRVTFKKADAFNLPFNDDGFDVCFSQGFFEHFADDDIRKLLKEQLRVSKKALFSVPSFWYPKRDFGDERLMKKEDWLRILSEFKLEKASYYSRRKGSEENPSQIYFKVIK
ncbi:2-methoxy-6-polyprenyl-1,4-benzoquinol methylase [subsurface metagenome]